MRLSPLPVEPAVAGNFPVGSSSGIAALVAVNTASVVSLCGCCSSWLVLDKRLRVLVIHEWITTEEDQAITLRQF
jgi:hypothetical protein